MVTTNKFLLLFLIPIRSRDNYLRNLFEKVESALKRTRWKALFFLKGEKFQEIKFRDFKNHFQETLANNLQKINSFNKIFVFAYKTRNILLETLLDTYNKLLHNNITKTYKHGFENQHSGNQQLTKTHCKQTFNWQPN